MSRDVVSKLSLSDAVSILTQLGRAASHLLEVSRSLLRLVRSGRKEISSIALLDNVAIALQPVSVWLDIFW